LRLTLIKYILREIYSFFFVGLLVFIFIIMATRMIWMTDLLVNQRVSPASTGHLILYAGRMPDGRTASLY
jgi:lipopolysaccharide export LptBFGC system permease protein LptF